MPLKLTIPLVLVFPVLLVTAGLMTIGMIQGRSTVRNLVDQNLQNIHREINERVEDLMNVPERVNLINRTLIREGKLDPADLRHWPKVLFQQAHAAGDLSAIVWGGKDGQAMFVARYAGDADYTFCIKDDRTDGRMHEYILTSGGDVADNFRRAFAFDPHTRPWYIAPIEAGHAAWSEPYVWLEKNHTAGKTLGLAYGEPCHDADGNLLGVIAAELSLYDISQFLSGLHIGQTGLTFVMDHRGRLIAGSTEAPLADEHNNPIEARNSADPRIATTATHIKTTSDAIDHGAKPLTQTLNIDGEKYLLMVSPFEHRTGLRWIVATLVPEKDFMGAIEAAQRISLVTAGAMVLLTVLLGVALAIAMVNPILLLVQHVRKIGDGDLDLQLKLDQSPEMSQLSDEINAMTAGLRDRMRMRISLALAMEVQQGLLPQKTPTIEGLDIAGHSTYCDETGGDYYDYLELIGLSEKSVAVVVGDVMGHGVAAAMLMATARGILKSRCHEPGNLAELLTHMNTLLVPDTGGFRFMTMLLMAIDTSKRQMRWASAGHDMPFVYDPSADEFIVLQGGGIPLGVLEDQTYKEFTLEDVKKGMVFVAGTDGLWEAVDGTEARFGKQRICELIRRNAQSTAEQISQTIIDDLNAFRGDVSLQDDVTLVVVKAAY